MLTTLIVVPVLNESATLNDQLSRLRVLREQGAEVLLVDGDSVDSTRDIIRAEGFSLLESERGRAIQMNAGARAMQSDILIFLHADTRLPPDSLLKVEQHLSQGRQWGRFDVRIVGSSSWFAVIAFFMNIRSRLTGIATGDQTFFMTREAFDAVGGFPIQPLMEDIEMSKRLKRLSAPVCLHDRVETSGRRWEQHGVWTTILLMWRLRWAYWRGTPANTLARLYR
ncbi:TIGR04283 family arsenosugar biosynthesis glycosyltransferase [Zwartia sp.]|uniref:TIGR04283 family arsenosugar biosynthesis glycosyltransferase n=1 Tax=Zwartia sp. TaxID=2978004 RepID=UPI0027237E82|nr:TIGR04283 family arsenosugar biosynthesis glycosyltransferase [Zwartia sp.]MDO9023452.1 TIGR04283 family arsenosugar biosynthesis glycosyltransferase [Zwartia sp.]